MIVVSYFYLLYIYYFGRNSFVCKICYLKAEYYTISIINIINAYKPYDECDSKLDHKWTGEFPSTLGGSYLSSEPKLTSWLKTLK